jgi:hypothetical protein
MHYKQTVTNIIYFATTRHLFRRLWHFAQWFGLGMLRILFLPDIRYPASPDIWPDIRPHRISGRISGRAIRYPAGYRISKKAGLSGQISGASLVWTSVVDPDPDWSRIQRLCGSGSVLGIRIQGKTTKTFQ